VKSTQPLAAKHKIAKARATDGSVKADAASFKDKFRGTGIVRIIK